MRKLKLPGLIVAYSIIILSGCKKDIRNDRNSPDQLIEKVSAKKPGLSSAELKVKFNRLTASLPTNYEKRRIEKSATFLNHHSEYRNFVQSVLAITPTPCDDNTQLSQWLNQQLNDWDAEVINYAIATAMLDLPAYDALVFENSSTNQYFGVNGEYTQRLTKTFKDLKRFWNIQSNDIVMVAMHGSILRDRNKLIRTYMAAFELSQPDAEFFADFVLALLDFFPQYRNGDHPIFTFNAFAQESFDLPPYGVIPYKIVMGDGVMEGYTAIGYGDVAPQVILAHEFGHHIQFQLGLFEDETSPEATRRTELMADAYAGYYLSHARGASMQWKRVQQFLQVFFNTGDCAFTSDNHHGTPAQRMAAAEWGYSIANNAQKQGHILSAEAFTALFEAQLPQIVAH